MPDRSVVAEVTQVGVEATPGVAVAAARRLESVSLSVAPDVESDTFRPKGSKFATLVNPVQESATLSIDEGRVTYDELAYLLSSILGTAVVAPVVGTAGAYLWTWTPGTTTADTPKTLTIEEGQAMRAHRVAYGLLTELTMGFARDSAPDLGGSGIARQLEDPVVLTPGATALAGGATPVQIDDVSIFLDPTHGALGTTKLLRAFGLDLTIGDRFGGVWPIDAAQASFAGHVERVPTTTIGLEVEADAQGMALLGTMRAGSTSFLRLEANGPQIDAGPATHRLRIDAAVKVESPGDFGEVDDVRTVDWDTQIVADAGWGKALEVSLVNKLAAL